MPEARSSGAGELLRGALAEMRRREHWISIIMPARAGTYFPYQWELCYHQYHYSVSVKELKAIGLKWGSLRLFTQIEDIDAMACVYRSFVEGKHGYVERSRAYWRQIVEEHTNDHGYIYILENDGHAEGYIFYKLLQGKMLIREMAYSCRQAFLGLVRFLYQHSSQVEVAEWNAPLDDWLYFLLPDAKRGVTLEPFMSARVVDAAQVLAAITYPKGIDATIVFDIEDELAPWNNKVLALTINNGTGQVNMVLERPDKVVRCSIGAFTQLVFGRLGVYELMQMGRIYFAEPNMRSLLDRLFPKCNNYVNEYY
jgi:predicted acetyltransferase